MKIITYSCLFLLCFGVDRWSKWWALVHDIDMQIFPFLDFSLLWNRGVSWGMFHGASEYGFYLLTAFIGLLTLGLAYYALYYQWYQRKASIYFELLILAGAVSNLVDRFMFGGVVDFIQFHIGTWYWPTFNGADVFIVVGVIGLFLKNMQRSHEN